MITQAIAVTLKVGTVLRHAKQRGVTAKVVAPCVTYEGDRFSFTLHTIHSVHKHFAITPSNAAEWTVGRKS